MDVVKDTKEKAHEVTSGGREKGSVAKKVLVSLAASAASGATAYAARKVPGFVQDKVLPKLKEFASNGGGAVDKARKVVESAVPAVGSGQTSQGSRRPTLSDDEREKRQRARAQHRRERKAALSR